MEAYSSFAEVYDIFQDNVPYEEWCSYVTGLLREQGVEVPEGVLEDECARLNKVFFHYIQTKHPVGVMKYAMTLDGKIAAYTGASKWITGEAAREHVQRQRHRYSGIMVGVGTVLTDDPSLACHMEGRKNPVRIICDTHLRTPLQAQVVMTAGKRPTILATCCTDLKRCAAYMRAGCRVLCLNCKDCLLYTSFGSVPGS